MGLGLGSEGFEVTCHVSPGSLFTLGVRSYLDDLGQCSAVGLGG